MDHSTSHLLCVDATLSLKEYLNHSLCLKTTISPKPFSVSDVKMSRYAQHSENTRRKAVAQLFARMQSVWVERGWGERAPEFKFSSSFLFPPSALSLWCLEEGSLRSCSLALTCYSFKAHSLSSSPRPSSLFLHLLCSFFLSTQSENTHIHTHTDTHTHT